MLVVFLRVVGGVVQSSRFSALQGAFDDEAGYFDDVTQFENLCRNFGLFVVRFRLLLEKIDSSLGALQP